jgi:hypothetical protein
VFFCSTFSASLLAAAYVRATASQFWKPGRRLSFLAPLGRCDLALEKSRLGMNENEISKILVESGMEVHRKL